jgi:PASTA domain
MSMGGRPWQEGSRAWERLTGWHRERGHPDDGDAALDALSDVGQVRRLLDEAELVAVRTARGHRKPWAEIATRLGVTRQSAWEKWRELDDTPAAAADLEAVIAREAGAAILQEPPRRGRRQCVVPDVVALTVDDARDVLLRAGLSAVSADPDGPPLEALRRGVVIKQDPTQGAVWPAGAPVRLWIEAAGGAGDREPRRPTPGPLSARELPDELSDEAAGVS